MTEDLFPTSSPDSPPADAAAGSSNAEPNVIRIGDVCRLTGTKAFVLRYWETEFPMLAPHKSSKGQRLYRREDIDVVLEIKRLLYEQGFTIAGARRRLESGGRDGPESGTATAPVLPSGTTATRKLLVDIEEELRSILTLLESG